MMAALPYMQLYVADYLADTMHLDALEHGAYLLLLMNYWQTGKPLPDDDKKLARIARCTDEQWLNVRSTLVDFFINENGFWLHNRVENDLEKVRSKSIAASQAGKKSAQVRQKNTTKTNTLNERSTDVQRNGNHTDTDTDTDITIAGAIVIGAPDGSKKTGQSVSRETKSGKQTPRQALEEVLTPEMAGHVIEHRQKKRSPLTAFAAKQLAKKLAKCRDGPEAAATMMIERGWTGFQNDWYDNAKQPNGNAGSAAGSYDDIRRQSSSGRKSQLRPGRVAGDDQCDDDGPGSGVIIDMATSRQTS